MITVACGCLLLSIGLCSVSMNDGMVTAGVFLFGLSCLLLLLGVIALVLERLSKR